MNEGSAIKPPVSAEQELWKHFQQGDEKALATIYSLYFDHLYGYGFRFTHDATLVEDCIQELFIKLIRNKQNLSLPDSVKNYLFKAFRSYLFDKLGKLKKHSVQEIQESQDFELESYRESLIIKNEELGEKQGKLGKALKELTPRQREAIFLKYHEGFSYPEIAEMMKLTQKAAYKLVGRAIQVLRSAVASGFWAVVLAGLV